MVVAGAVLTVALFTALTVFYARQLRVGGRWGQRPAAHRVFALSGMLFFGGLVLALIDLAVRHGSPGPVFVAGNVLLTAGLLLVTLVEPLLRRRDERHAQHIHRSVGLR